jgi:hypothetical protein
MFLSSFFAVFLVIASTSTAPVSLIEPPKEERVLSVDEIIKNKAKEHAVSEEIMRAVIDCESHGSTTVQSNYYYKGVREDSWGLVQINLPWNPQVTKEQALDPEFSADFLARNLKAGKGDLWTCYRDLRL